MKCSLNTPTVNVKRNPANKKNNLLRAKMKRGRIFPCIVHTLWCDLTAINIGGIIETASCLLILPCHHIIQICHLKLFKCKIQMQFLATTWKSLTLSVSWRRKVFNFSNLASLRTSCLEEFNCHPSSSGYLQTLNKKYGFFPCYFPLQWILHKMVFMT